MVELSVINKGEGNAGGVAICQSRVHEAYMLALKLQDMGAYLGGSRRMGQRFPTRVIPKADADWDMYMEWNTPNRIALYDMGLRDKEVARNYCDESAVAIYEHADLSIQVVLRHNVERYRCMFENITLGEYLRIWKSNPDCPVEDLVAFYEMVRSFINSKLRGY